MNFIKSLTKKKKFLATLSLVAIAGAYASYRSLKAENTSPQYLTSAIARGAIISSVSGTGQVEASDRVDIKPQTDGTITKVLVKENQRVKKGDIIATIDQQTSANDVAKARASLEQAQASYDKIIAGATNNEIRTQELSVQAAERSLQNAKDAYEETVIEQQRAVDKALSDLYNDGLQPVAANTLTSATVSLSGNYFGKTEGQYKISLYQAGDGIHYSVSGLGSESGPVNRGTAQPLGNGLYITFGSSGNFSLSTTWTIDIPNQTSSSYASKLNSYNTAIQNQRKNIKQAADDIESAEAALEKSRLQRDEALEPATSADITAARAQVTSARAQLENAIEALDNTVIKAPFDGVVADLAAGAGDEANSGSTIATIITQQQVAKITLNEVDAAKVKVGQKTTLAFSSVPELAITGTVAEVDNIGTVSQNVVNFSVTIALDIQDDRIKPGMSVTASIVTALVQNVLTVPAAAIKSANGQNYIQVLVNGVPERRNVILGLSNDTDTEISGGIQEGDSVITQTINAQEGSSRSSNANLLQGLMGGNRSQIRSSGNSGLPSGGAVIPPEMIKQ